MPMIPFCLSVVLPVNFAVLPPFLGRSLDATKFVHFFLCAPLSSHLSMNFELLMSSSSGNLAVPFPLN